MVAVAIIPARAGSKSIPDKNLQKIGGKSLLQHTVEAAQLLNSFDRVFVLTDSEDYASHALSLGAEVPYIRGLQSSNDMASDIDVFLELLDKVPLRGDTVLAHLRPTTPLRKVKVLQEALDIFGSSVDEFSSLRSVQEMPESALKSFLVDRSGMLLPILDQNTDQQNLPRQLFPKTFSANGYIDLFNVEQVLTGSLHGSKIHAFVTEPVIEIDSLFELEIARLMFNNIVEGNHENNN